MPHVSIISAGPHTDVEVWIQMVPGDPTTMGESFILATGEDDRDAREQAIKELRALIEQLEGPQLKPGEVDHGRD